MKSVRLAQIFCPNEAEKKIRQDSAVEFISASLAANLQFFARGNVTVKSNFVPCHAQREPDKLLQVEDRHIGL